MTTDGHKIRVLIVDDTSTARNLLRGIIREDPLLEVIGTAGSGEEAIASIARMHPDIVTMDIHMPGMNGFEATRFIMSSHPIPIVIISSAFHPGESELSFKALEAGALTILPPPHGPGHVDFVKSARKLNTTLKLLAEVKVVRRSQPIPSSGPSAHREAQPAFTAPLQKTPPRFQGKSSTGILAIGASAGGPSALQTLFSGIDSTIPVPVIVVQHIEKGFAQGFAEWLGTHSTIPVRIAGDGEKMIPGVVYLPPGDYHISVREPGTIALSKGIPQNGLRPAVDVLFQSVARIYGPAAAGILLSGMGKDGASGLLSMKESGSFTLAQDEVSSLVFGMPGEAIRIGAACSVCPPDRMSRLIMHYFSETNSTKP